jgi:hypothetical protein
MAWFAFLFSVVVVCEAPTLVSGDYIDFFCFVFLSYFAGQKVWQAVSRGFLPGRVALMKGGVWIGSDGV